MFPLDPEACGVVGASLRWILVDPAALVASRFASLLQNLTCFVLSLDGARAWLVVSHN